jgi:large subunit ribosomal protein L17
MKNLALALFKHSAIETTVPKSKELKKFAEPLITLARQDTVANRRIAFAALRDNTVVTRLFTEIAPQYGERAGGYTRILRLGHRAGDAAPMARIELVGLGEYKEE